MLRSLFASWAFALLAASAATPRACNNSPALCNRAYNNVTYLGAHDSAFVRNSSNRFSVGGNQFFTSPVQLDAGVRLLTSQIHKNSGGFHLCHTLCQIYDAGTVSGWLASIRAWLDTNPNEVITILLVNGDGVSRSDIDAQFRAAHLAHYAYTPPSTTKATITWPTLNELISMRKRLIVFIQPLAPEPGSGAQYLLDQFIFTFENQYDVTNPSAFSCTANRPSTLNGNTALALSSGRLPIMNHFLDELVGTSGIEIPDVDSSPNTNAAGAKLGSLGAAATSCTAQYKKPPNFLLVDFFNVGPAISTADKLNGLTAKNVVGRRALPASIYSTGAGPTQTAALVHVVVATSAAAASTTTAKAYSPSTGTAASADVKQNAVSRLDRRVPSAGTVLGSILGIPLVAGLRDALL